jgi:hypothetical protein
MKALGQSWTGPSSKLLAAKKSMLKVAVGQINTLTCCRSNVHDPPWAVSPWIRSVPVCKQGFVQ